MKKRSHLGDGPRAVSDLPVRNLYQDGDAFIAGAPALESLPQLHERGVRLVVDLRLPDQVEAGYEQAVRAAGMEYVRVSIAPDAMPAAAAEQVLQALAEHGSEGVLKHCSGGNRGGAAYALYATAVGGCSPEEAIARAKAAGLRNESLIRDVQAFLEGRRQAASGPASQSARP